MPPSKCWFKSTNKKIINTCYFFFIFPRIEYHRIPRYDTSPSRMVKTNMKEANRTMELGSCILRGALSITSGNVTWWPSVSWILMETWLTINHYISQQSANTGQQSALWASIVDTSLIPYWYINETLPILCHHVPEYISQYIGCHLVDALMGTLPIWHISKTYIVV